jgi:hypothetical protein
MHGEKEWFHCGCGNTGGLNFTADMEIARTTDMANTDATTEAKPAPAVAAKRDKAWDFAKGALVLCMVLYHSLNYLRHDRGGAALLYLRFLPPSFIFITGFLITHIYLARYRADDPRLQKRLLLRGAKLLAVFAVLNILVNVLMTRNFNGMNFGLGAFIDHLPEIFITGEGRHGIFLVLAPIAYLLMISGVLLLAHKFLKWSLHLVFIAAAVTELILDNNGYTIPNLRLLAAGLLGMVFGLSPADKIETVARQWWLAIVVCAAYFLALNWWGDDTWLEYIGVCVMAGFFYSIGRLCGDGNFASGTLALLGSYSLLAYISQIVVLQLLLRIFHRLNLERGVEWIGFFAATALMIGLVHLTDWSRKKWPAADGAYRAVFA